MVYPFLGIVQPPADGMRRASSPAVSMHQLASRLFVIFVHLGAFGLLALGILDSSFLVMPLGNDLLIIALSARNHSLWFFYAVVATAGSLLGCLLMDVISRKGGEE